MAWRDEILQLCNEIYFRTTYGGSNDDADRQLLIAYQQTWSVHDHQVHGQLHNTLGVISYYSGHLHEACDHFLTAAEESEQAGQYEETIMSFSNTAHVALLLGNYALAAQRTEDAHSILVAHTPSETFGGIVAMKINTALYYALSGQDERAVCLLQAIFDAASHQPHAIQKMARFGACRGLSLIQVRVGDLVAADEWLQQARAHLSPVDIPLQWLHYYLAADMVAAAKGDHEQVIVHQAAVWALIDTMRHSQMQVGILNSAILAVYLTLNQQARWMLNMGAYHLSVPLTSDLMTRYRVLRELTG